MAITLSMDEELVFARAGEPGWASARGTSTRLARTIATFVLATLCIPASPKIDLVHKIYRRGERRANESERRI
jgi:hypothetical protein